MPELRLNRAALMQLAVMVEGGLLVLALGLGWLVGHSPFAHFFWNGTHALLILAGTVPLLVVLLVTGHIPWGPLVRLREIIQRQIVPIFRPCTLADFALISLLAGLGEEALFRAVMQSWLSDLSHPVAGLIVASVLFGLAHLITPTYAVLATLIGLYLGGLWMATENLFLVAGIHALYDFIALVYLVRIRGGDEAEEVEPSLAEEDETPEPSEEADSSA